MSKSGGDHVSDAENQQFGGGKGVSEGKGEVGKYEMGGGGQHARGG